MSAENGYECNESRQRYIPDKDSTGLSILSCFLRNNLSTSTSKEILQTFRSAFPNVPQLQELTFQNIWSQIDCRGVKEFHYCTTYNKVFLLVTKTISNVTTIALVCNIKEWKKIN